MTLLVLIAVAFLSVAVLAVLIVVSTRHEADLLSTPHLAADPSQVIVNRPR